MKNALLCFVTDSKDFDYIDKMIEKITENEKQNGLNPIKTYVAIYTKNGLTNTDTDEIEYLLQSEGIIYLIFAIEKSRIYMTRDFSRYFVDLGYIVLFFFYD